MLRLEKLEVCIRTLSEAYADVVKRIEALEAGPADPWPATIEGLEAAPTVAPQAEVLKRGPGRPRKTEAA